MKYLWKMTSFFTLYFWLGFWKELMALVQAFKLDIFCKRVFENLSIIRLGWVEEPVKIHTVLKCLEFEIHFKVKDYTGIIYWVVSILDQWKKARQSILVMKGKEAVFQRNLMILVSLVLIWLCFSENMSNFSKGYGEWDLSINQLREVSIAGTLTNISRHAVGRLLKRVKSCGSRGLSKEDDGYLRPCDSTGMVNFVNCLFLAFIASSFVMRNFCVFCDFFVSNLQFS
mgnify:FL=1